MEFQEKVEQIIEDIIADVGFGNDQYYARLNSKYEELLADKEIEDAAIFKEDDGSEKIVITKDGVDYIFVRSADGSKVE